MTNFLNYLNGESFLFNSKERKSEKILENKINSFLENKNNERKKLKIKDSLNLPNEKILNTLLIDEELIIIVFKDSLKLYNYKNKKYISTIDINVNDNNNSFDDLKLTKINRDIIAIYNITCFILFFNNKNLFNLSKEYNIIRTNI